jgi:acetylornithine/N-succinyldiaminopimelate aminotransferase
MRSLTEREHDVIFQTYSRLPIEIASASGCRITATDGTVYLDFLGGIAVNALGHSHPHVVQNVIDQAQRYMHVSNFFYQEPQIRLAELLREASGYPRVFFTNSGAEATDGAMKMARRYGSKAGRYDIVGFTGGFHGRTYGALSIMDKPLYKEGMGPFLPNTLVLPYNDVDALLSRVDASTCAIMLEFVQGEGGLREATPEFVEALAQLQRDHGVLIIADEVQAGIGRTGTFFAFERYGIKPDIVICAKAMGGGLPLGAILATEEAAALFDRGMHGTTYGGNAVACAAGIAVLEEVRGGLMDHVQRVGSYLNTRLQELQREHPAHVQEIRGRGCMQGIVLTSDAAPVVRALLERDVIANATAGTVIRLVPPYIITETDVDEFVAALHNVFAAA